MDNAIQTISVQYPCARLLLGLGRGIVAKAYHYNELVEHLQNQLASRLPTRIGLHCCAAAAPGAVDEVFDNTNIEVKHGHVFGTANVVGWVHHASSLPLSDFAYSELCRVASSIMDVSEINKWLCFAIKTNRTFYVLNEIKRCKPFEWKGAMSLFPVPSERFEDT